MEHGYNSEIESSLNRLADSVGLESRNRFDAGKLGHISSKDDGKGNLIVTLDPIQSDSQWLDTRDKTDAMKKALESVGIKNVKIVIQYAKSPNSKKIAVTDPEEIKKGNSDEGQHIFQANKLVIEVPNDKGSLDKIEEAHVKVRTDIAKKYVESGYSNAKAILKPLGFRADKALDTILKEQGLRRVPEKTKGNNLG